YDQCVPAWPAQEAALQPPDAGPPMTPSPCDDGTTDAGIDGALDADAGGRDANAPDVAGEDTSSSARDAAGVDASVGSEKTDDVTLGGSGCEVGGARGAGGGGVASAVAFALAMLWR